MKRVDTILH